MGFQVRALEKGQFDHLIGKDTEFLAKHGVGRMTVDCKPGYPCRVSLKDVDIGETVLLMNFEHLSTTSPYRSSHAIFVHERASEAVVGKNQVPELLRIRLISVRAFDVEGMMVDADVVEGRNLESVINRMFSTGSANFLHLHNAQRGCFIARVDRV